MIDQLGDVYADARAEPPYESDARWHRDAFVSRTSRQVADPDFVLVAAYADGQIVGFSFGQPIAPGRWFDGDTEPPAEILASSKFAVIELDVRRSWRSQGIGRALLDALLANRHERYAMLSTLPGTASHGMYRRWGWFKVAQIRSDSGYPPWDTFVLPLPLSTPPDV